MTVEGIVKTVCKQNGMSMTELGEAAGLKKTTALARIHRSDRIVLDNLMDLLDHLGCELVIRDNARGCEYHIDRG